MDRPTDLHPDAIQAGRNPRRYFDPTAMEELTNSVRAQGIIQPLTVRVADSGYELVAGERRLRAAREAGLESVPVVVREYTDREALDAASAENVQRQDMAPSEEARVARDLLDLHNGDRQEVMRRLGWSASILDARLALLHATDAVLDALDQRTITHKLAGLLSSLPADKQDATLKAAIDKGVSADELRRKIHGFSLSLDQANFDKSECQNCPHNSMVQATLLATGLEGANCSNPTCYNAKTQTALSSKKEELAEEYPVVFFDLEKREDSRTVLMRRGENGVGDAQYAACQSCQHYGALLHSSADKAGQVEDGMCFNLDCHREKVGAHREAMQQASEPAAGTAGTAQTSARGTESAGAGTKKGASSAKGTSASNTETGPMREAAEKSIRAQAGRVIAARPHWSLATAVAALAHEVDALGHGKGAANAGVTEAVACALAEDRQTTKVIPALALCSEADLFDAQQRLAGMMMERTGMTVNAPEETVAAAKIVNESDADPNGCMWVTDELIKAERKAGLVTLLRESGFADSYDKAHGEGAFKKLVKGKLADMREAINTTAHDWSGYMPTPIASRLKGKNVTLSDKTRTAIEQAQAGTASASGDTGEGETAPNAEAEPEAEVPQADAVDPAVREAVDAAWQPEAQGA